MAALPDTIINGAGDPGQPGRPRSWSSRFSDSQDRTMLLYSFSRGLISMVRGSGIRRDYILDDSNVVGRGQYGVVCTATRISDKEVVAIKKITKKGRSQKSLENVKHEIEIMRKVNHPNCIKLYDIYESSKHVYIVMELVQGGELLDRIINKEHYTELEAANCFSQMMSAVEYLHNQGIVHRDIKPENILYMETRKSSAIKLVDYGLSRCFDTTDLNEGRVRMMSRCGSPNFVAPEVLAGHGYGKSCDIWSAGVILYVLLCGFLPFDSYVVDDHKDQIRMPIVTERVEFPEACWERITTEAKSLITAMLVVDHELRITTEEVMAHPWMDMCRQGRLPTADMPQMQARLKDNWITRKLLGAINGLSALRMMLRADVDWEAIHIAMRQAASECLSSIRLEPEREAELRMGFDLLDRDKSGRISLSNLADSMKALGHLQDPNEVDYMLKRFDLYQTGDISFEEYCIMMSMPARFHLKWAPTPASIDPGEGHGLSSPEPEELIDNCIASAVELELLETFKTLDVDSSGFIDVENLKEIMSRLGTTLTEEEARKMIEIADYKQNGVIEFDEFVELMSSESKARSEARTPLMLPSTPKSPLLPPTSPISAPLDACWHLSPNTLKPLHKKDKPVIPPWDNTIRKLQSEITIQSEIQETTGFGRERSESIAEEDESADISDVFSRASLVS